MPGASRATRLISGKARGHVCPHHAWLTTEDRDSLAARRLKLRYVTFRGNSRLTLGTLNLRLLGRWYH